MEVKSVAPETFSDERVITLSIAFHPDHRRIGEQAKFVRPGTIESPLEISRIAPIFSRPETRGQNPISDGFVSRKPVMLAGLDNDALRIWCPTGGAKNSIDGQSLSHPQEFSSAQQEQGLTLNLAGRVILVLRRTPLILRKSPHLGLIGISTEIDHVRKQITKVADTNTPVFIQGETGTGKELVAQAIHEQSLRATNTFLAINMAAIPQTTAVSQLFGHTKGAFSGADREHSGYFGQAQGGTLFMDEIGETSLETQAILLRVLETNKRQPVGSNEEKDVDVRVLTATDLDLEIAVEEGRIREPLVHRLRAFDIQLPRLQERPEDIGPLFLHFLKTELTELGEWTSWAAQAESTELWMAPEFMEMLIEHSWRGNVRELRNLARKLAIANRGQRFLETRGISLNRERAVSAPPEANPVVPASSVPTIPARQKSMPSTIDSETLLAALKKNKWRAGPTASELGISRSSLYTMIEQNPDVPKAKDISKQQLEAARSECNGDLDQMAERLQVSKRALQLREKDLG